MTPALTRPQLFAIGFEIALFFAGVVLLGLFQFSPDARERLKRPAPLPFWPITVSSFALATLCVMGVAVFVQASFGPLLQKFFPHLVPKDFWLVIIGSGLHIGMLIGLLVGRSIIAGTSKAQTPADLAIAAEFSALPTPPPLPPGKTVLAGIATFAITMAVVLPAFFAWQLLLQGLHVPIEKQPLIDIFAQTESRGLVVLLIFLVAVVAPVTEELIFRAGLFRFLRGRVPRATALLVPAALFAGLHMNLAAFLPLLLLGGVFSIAYERTGRIAVSMIAHSLFNLHTVVMLFVGLNF